MLRSEFDRHYVQQCRLSTVDDAKRSGIDAARCRETRQHERRKYHVYTVVYNGRTRRPINPLKSRDINWLHFAIQI